MSPFSWSAHDFLILYVALLVIAALVSAVAPALRRPNGRDATVTEPTLLALLAGGRLRLIDMLVAARLQAGELRVTERGRFAGTGGRDQPWSALTRTLTPQVERAERQLRDAGLTVDGDTQASLRRWAALPFVALAAFGAVRLVRGLLLDHSVGYLVALMVVTLIAALIRWFGVDLRTPAGKRAVGKARRSHDRLRRAPTRPEMALGVALFGTAVLAGSEFASFHQFRAPSDSGSGGGSDGSSDGGCGGGGCGGGGCGG